MELRCLLGHEFGEREVERERREAGDEVVVVYRTVENCRRCGTRRVVSENKEVRSIDAVAEEAPATVEAGTGDAGAETDADADAESDRPPAVDAGAESLAGSGTDGGSTGGTDGGADDGEAPARPGSLIEAAEAVGAAETGEGGATDDREGDDATDDAVIIGGNGTAGSAAENGDADDRDADPAPATDAAGTAAGANPADGTAAGTDEDVTAPEGGVELLGGGGDAGNGTEETDGAGTAAGVDAAGTAAGADGADGTDAGGAAAGWPEPSPGAEDEGYDASPHEDTATGVDFGGGLAPAAAGDAAGDGVEPAFVGAGDRSVAARDADGPTELCCANCGATRAAAGSSLRGGDICPDCRKGYVAERTIEE